MNLQDGGPSSGSQEQYMHISVHDIVSFGDQSANAEKFIVHVPHIGN